MKKRNIDMRSMKAVTTLRAIAVAETMKLLVTRSIDEHWSNRPDLCSDPSLGGLQIGVWR